MSITTVVNSSTYHLTTNRQERPVFDILFDPLEGWRRMKESEYLLSNENERYTGFEYRGWVHAINEFDVAGDDVKALGFDGVSAQSAFDAIVVTWFDADGEYIGDEGVVVGHIHW